MKNQEGYIDTTAGIAVSKVTKQERRAKKMEEYKPSLKSIAKKLKHHRESGMLRHYGIEINQAEADIIIPALEAARAREPVRQGEKGYFFHCPRCGETVGVGSSRLKSFVNFCDTCGQHINWGKILKEAKEIESDTAQKDREV